MTTASTVLDALVECYNPNLTVPLAGTSAGSPMWGRRAVTRPVQFNVRKPATVGTIFVNDKNLGVCRITLRSNHKITTASYGFGLHEHCDDDQGIYMRDVVKVSSRSISKQVIEFYVEQAKDYSGNLTVIFEFHYLEAGQPDPTPFAVT
ncbi:hypothetical protein [Pseudorhodoferax sp.]|uniref:hypothetical protein n=1 Tax=Pseudorhodoferax sp. TaxID=1993553 RepID=UPI002DD640A0|nr:hypothetical protein [Pseudorhodoferax sp.]